MVEAILALGSNLGDRVENLRAAVEEIGRSARIIVTSGVYQTEPMYYERQGPFLNCALAIETNASPSELLSRLKAIEEHIGRRPGGPRYGPRKIDIDILFYGDVVSSDPALSIPHPKIAERAFVLVPLVEIRPRLVHPESGKTVAQMLAALGSTEGVVRVPGLSVNPNPSRRTR